MSLAFTTIRYGVFQRRFVIPSSEEALLDMLRKEFVIDSDLPLGLSYCPDPEDLESFTVLPFDVKVLEKLESSSTVLDLRVYAKRQEGSSRHAKSLPPNTVVAQFSFSGQSSRELSFHAGDCIVVEGKFSEDWWKGSINGEKHGYFPANYVSGLESVEVGELNEVKCNFQDEEYFEGYSNLGIHLEMLQDNSRTKTYFDAIMQASDFLKGKIVLDVGCGSSILSIFCAKAGAEHVFAVEASDVADHAQVVIEENGLADKISLIRGKMEEVELPVDHVDVIVSEWMGTLLICESMIASVLFARQKYLKPGGLMLPSSSDIFLSPICIDEYYNKRIQFWDNVYDVKMTGLKSVANEEFFSKPVFDRIIAANELISKPCPVSTIDMSTSTVEDLESLQSAFEFKIGRTCTMHGFGGWFDSVFYKAPDSMDDAITLSTSPLSTPTHWKQVMFVLEKPLQVEEGTVISGTFRVSRQKFWRRHFEVELVFNVDDSRESISQTFPLWR